MCIGRSKQSPLVGISKNPRDKACPIFNTGVYGCRQGLPNF